jgi:hypothetical protein
LAKACKAALELHTHLPGGADDQNAWLFSHENEAPEKA